MHSAPLADRHILAIAGDDRIAFLQGLITNDANELAHGKSLYAALLSPQGKFLHDFFLIPHTESILLDVSQSRAGDLQARLNMYKLRSKVTIEPRPQMRVAAVWNGNPATPSDTIAIADPRLEALGMRLYGESPVPADAEAADYDAHRISLIIPDGAKDMRVDKSLLLEFGFESLHGVNFSKGCYVGQEVTARSKFRGQVRKALYGVSSDSALPAQGTEITSGDKIIGELLGVSGMNALAQLRWEELEKLEGPLKAQDATLRYRWPEWNKKEA